MIEGGRDVDGCFFPGCIGPALSGHRLATSRIMISPHGAGNIRDTLLDVLTQL